MSRWNRYKEQTPSSGGKYVKLQDGDSITFALTNTEPGQRVQWWLDGKPVSESTEGAQPDMKIMICIYDVKLRAMRLLSLTPNTFVRLCEKISEFGEDFTFRVKRLKKHGKVQYEIDRMDRLTPEQRQARDREKPFDPLDENDVTALPQAQTEQTQGEQAPIDEAAPF